jgi:hypothetical protein
MVFIEPSILIQIGGAQPMRRSKQFDYELESKRRVMTGQSQPLFIGIKPG